MNIREYGFNALLSCWKKLAYGQLITQSYTPAATGLDRFIDWTRDDYIGHGALVERGGNGPAKSLSHCRLMQMMPMPLAMSRFGQMAGWWVL